MIKTYNMIVVPLTHMGLTVVTNSDDFGTKNEAHPQDKKIHSNIIIVQRFGVADI